VKMELYLVSDICFNFIIYSLILVKFVKALCAFEVHFVGNKTLFKLQLYVMFVFFLMLIVGQDTRKFIMKYPLTAICYCKQLCASYLSVSL